MNPLTHAKYIIKDIINNNHDGTKLVRDLFLSYKSDGSAHEIFKNAESFRDLLDVFRLLNEEGRLHEVDQLLEELGCDPNHRRAKRRKVSERSDVSPRSPSTPPARVLCSPASSTRISDDTSTRAFLCADDENPSAPQSPSSVDDDSSTLFDSDKESVASESDLESIDDAEEKETDIEPGTLATAFHGTYFAGLTWSPVAQNAFTMKLPDWPSSIPTISRMGELLEAPKTIEAVILLRIAIKLMEDDFEAQDLVNIDAPVFEEFWKRGRAVCTCIMQGGKTRRAIFLRGLVHAGVHKKHAVVLANGMSVAYNDMLSSMKDLNSEYQLKIPERIRRMNLFLPKTKLFLGTRLNQKKGFDELDQRTTNQVHFNIRLSNVRALESLSTAFKDRIDFNSDNTHLILDESHEALGGRQFSTRLREQLVCWKDVTLVTATPEAQFVVPELLGNAFRHVSILPRPGYYLYGPNEDEPRQDEDDVLVVNYDPMLANADPNVSADKMTMPFPREYFPLVKKGRKRKGFDEEKEKGETGASAVEPSPCSVPDDAVFALDKICRIKRSFFCIVLNNHIGQDSKEKKKSINVGHGAIAKWFMQQASVRGKTLSKEKDIRPSVVTYTVYQYSRASSEFGKPRLFFNEAFMRAIARLAPDLDESGKKEKSPDEKTKFDIVDLINQVLTVDPGRSNDRVLVTSKAFEKIMEHFEQASLEARAIYKETPPRDGSPFICYRDRRQCGRELRTFSLQLPRLEIKAVLSIVRFIHESRFEPQDEQNKPKYNYDTAPLQLAVFGNTLLKQSVNVESKCRQLQSTHLVYLRKPDESVDLVRLLQKLGRVDHGLTNSPFYKSAFGGEEDPHKRRPTVMMPQQYINLVLESPRRQRETAEKGHRALMDFFRRVMFMSTRKSTVMSLACPEFKAAEADAHAKAKKELTAADEACDQLKTWIRRGPPEFRKHASEIAKAIADQLVEVGKGEEAEIDLEGLIEIFDNGVHATQADDRVYRFLCNAPELPPSLLQS
ncbi:Hypothetical Protein FCC1311_059062 [Hondaea fermentalgiana]|uniref:Uncharacterized protein n=1 Tax=Hondaea fermentalgiana TaxID=2315210 RepID=A0A2R5GGG3_9STRA|nr:Hypothetical Protein FCC1311_059062 [Hondaea fermentalgiana]|eukprot:GBG29685.1 Hypothetical Protein FCC1311_059062 [Hondaea fermentalgiana]